MLQREEAYKIAQKCAQFLKERFNVKNVYIFGSVIGDGIWHKRSDIDIAVEGLSADKYFRALSDLSQILPSGLDLDLITLETVSPRLRERIISMNDRNKRDNENKIERLALLIKSELVTLDELLDQTKEIMDYALQNAVNILVKRSMGSCLQDFYSCIEMIFERVLLTFDEDIPESGEWHRALLEKMETSTPNRPAIISYELSLTLSDYLKFRHCFRHMYGSELDWDKLYDLAIKASNILDEFKGQINLFLSSIKKT